MNVELDEEEMPLLIFALGTYISESMDDEPKAKALEEKLCDILKTNSGNG